MRSFKRNEGRMLEKITRRSEQSQGLHGKSKPAAQNRLGKGLHRPVCIVPANCILLIIQHLLILRQLSDDCQVPCSLALPLPSPWLSGQAPSVALIVSLFQESNMG